MTGNDLLRERLIAHARDAACVLPASAIDQLCAYFELLRLWNRRLSLTALPVEEYGDEAVDRMLLEPAIAASYLPNSTKWLIDLGSGGGSPAIPLKLMRPEISLTMVESRGKKSAFLREAVRQLRLQASYVEAARYEDLRNTDAFAAKADAVSLRAVRIESASLALISGFLRPGGALLLFAASTGATGKGFEKVGNHVLLPWLGSHLEVLRRV